MTSAAHVRDITGTTEPHDRFALTDRGYRLVADYCWSAPARGHSRAWGVRPRGAEDRVQGSVDVGPPRVGPVLPGHPERCGSSENGKRGKADGALTDSVRRSQSWHDTFRRPRWASPPPNGSTYAVLDSRGLGGTTFTTAYAPRRRRDREALTGHLAGDDPVGQLFCWHGPGIRSAPSTMPRPVPAPNLDDLLPIGNSTQEPAPRARRARA